MSENTNAGGGETTDMADFATLVNELEDAALDAGATWDGCTDEFHRRLDARVMAAKAALHAALSAQPTGSGGVAAEPVAWAWESKRVVGYEFTQFTSNRPSDAEARNIRPLYEHPPVAAEPVAGWKLVPVEPTQAMWAAYRNADEGAILFHAAYRAMLAVAPTPPAEGGETERSAIWADPASPEAIAEIKRDLASLRNYPAPSPASPADDLNSLSAGAVHRDAVEAAYTVIDREMWEENWSTAHPAHKALKQLKALALAPAAPRKGPSEEEIKHAQLRLQQARNCIHGGSANSSTAEMLRVLASAAISWPLDGGMYSHHVRERASLLEAAIKLIDLDIAALLTPADQGETQAVGDGWQPISTAPKDGTPLLLACASWAHSTVLGKPVPMKIGGWHRDAGNWQIFGASWRPTHWRPLPKPPSPDQNRGEPGQCGAATDAEAGR